MNSVDNKKYVAEKLGALRKRNKYVDLTCTVCNVTTHIHVNDPTKYANLKDYICATCKKKRGG